uniref:Uncharacterized protein n=1 Tax=Arundo donax TaxID=35708 RepID=A0A0A8Y7S5_ARUDO
MPPATARQRAADRPAMPPPSAPRSRRSAARARWHTTATATWTTACWWTSTPSSSRPSA